MNRINYLDGHRGIAILLVVFYHAFSRWTELVPYEDDFAEFPIFKYGYLGVQLFFLISGFVIFMTLEKCNNIFTFIYRRWLRLFPAMLICSLFIYFTAEIFAARPLGQPEPKDLIPGLSFIHPNIWFRVTGIDMNNLEGAFWSLYVEFKFYIVASILYFTLGNRYLVYALFGCFITWFLVHYMDGLQSVKAISFLQNLTQLLAFKYFGWFSSGAAYYLYSKTKQKKWFIIGGIFVLISSLVEGRLDIGRSLAAILISSFFAFSIVSTKIQKIISNKFFLFVGFISYPLYLLHDNMMISMTIQFASYIDFIPAFLFPVIAISLISGLSYLVAKYAEPVVKVQLVRLFGLLKRPESTK